MRQINSLFVYNANEEELLICQYFANCIKIIQLKENLNILLMNLIPSKNLRQEIIFDLRNN